MSDSNRQNSNSSPKGKPLGNRDQALIASARAGDLQAINELMASYQKRVFGVCYRMVSNYDDAADLTQETLIRVLTNLDRFDGRAAFSTWVVRIAMNMSLTHLRKERRRRKTFVPTGSDSGGKGASAGHLHLENAQSREPEQEAGVEHSERARVLSPCLSEVGDEYRALIVLRDVQGLGYREICEVLELPIGTVKSRLFRARLALRKSVDRMEGTSSPDEDAPTSQDQPTSSHQAESTSEQPRQNQA